MADEEQGRTGLSQGEQIGYRAYNRDFGGGGAVLYLLASCAYPIGGYKIWLEAEEGLEDFRLMERAPGLAPQLVTYYVASWTSSQRLVTPPSTVRVTSAGGTQEVTVEPWS